MTAPRRSKGAEAMPYQPTRSATRLMALLALLALPFAGPASGQDDEDAGRLVVEAEDGIAWERANQRYVATGNAVATQGDIVFTAGRIEAHYRGGEDQQGTGGGGVFEMTRIAGTGGAELRKGGIAARSGSIDYDLLADRVVLAGGEPSIQSAGDSIAATGSIDYERRKREVRAKGGVAVKLDNGRTLTASRVFAKVSQGEDGFTLVRASGDAEISSTGAADARRATADEIEYRPADDLAVLTGSVAIFEGGHSITGGRAEFHLASGTSRITSDTGRVGGVFTSDR